MTAHLVYCLLLLLTTRYSSGEQKWSKPLADERTSLLSQDWVPVASSCPTCGRSILEAQATNAGLVLTPPILSPPPLPVYPQSSAGSYIAQTLGQQQLEIQQHFQQKQKQPPQQNVFLQPPSQPQSPPVAESQGAREVSTSAPPAEEVQLVYVPVETLRRQKQNSAAVPANLRIQAAHQAELLRNQQHLSRELQNLKSQQEHLPLQQQQVHLLKQETQQPPPQQQQQQQQQQRQQLLQQQQQQQQQEQQQPPRAQKYFQPARQEYQAIQLQQQQEVHLRQQQIQEPHFTQIRQEYQQPQITPTREEPQRTPLEVSQITQDPRVQLTQTRQEFQQLQPQLTQVRQEFQQLQPQVTQTKQSVSPAIQSNQEFQQPPLTQSPPHQRRRRPPPPASPTSASLQRTPTPSTTPTPYQPPLSVYMAPNAVGHSGVKLADVIKVLRNSKSIAVLDRVGPGTPDVFVGPSELDPPQGYAKFELPYLSSLGNRVERAPRPPFFVAPLSFKPPAGYSKIPFPAPHVGSVVVSANATTNSPESQQQFSLPAQLPPITAELPSLVNSLQSATLKPSHGDVHPVSHQAFSSTTQAPKRRPSSAYEEEEEVAKLLQTLHQSGVTPATTDSFQYNLASRTRQQVSPSTEKIPADSLQYNFASRGRQQALVQSEKTPNQYTPTPAFFPNNEPKHSPQGPLETQITPSGFPSQISSQTADQFPLQGSRSKTQFPAQEPEIQSQDHSALLQLPESESQYLIQQDEITTHSALKDKDHFAVQDDINQRVQTPHGIASPTFDNAPRYQVPQTERPSLYHVQDVKDNPQRQLPRYRGEKKQNSEILENNAYEGESVAVAKEPSRPSSVVQDEVYSVTDGSQFPNQPEAQDTAAPVEKENSAIRQRTQQQYQRTQENQFTVPQVPQYIPARQRGGSRRQQVPQQPPKQQQQQQSPELATENPSDSKRNSFLIQTVGPSEESLKTPVSQSSNLYYSDQGHFAADTPETPLHGVSASPHLVVTQEPQQVLAQDIVIQTQTQRAQFQNADVTTPQYTQYKIAIPEQTETPSQSNPALRIPEQAEQRPLEYPSEDYSIPQRVQNTQPVLHQISAGAQDTAVPEQQAIEYYEQTQETTTTPTTTTTTASSFRSRGRSRHRYTSAAADSTTSSPRSRPSYTTRSRSRISQYRTPRPSISAEIQQETVAISSFDQVGPFESSRRPAQNTPRSIGTEQETGQRAENSLRTRTRGRSRSRVSYTAAATTTTATTTTTTTTPPPESPVPQFTIYAESPQFQQEVQQQNINVAYSGSQYIQQAPQEQLPASTDIPLAIGNVATTEIYPQNFELGPLEQQDSEYATEVPIQGKYDSVPSISPVTQATVATTERNQEDPSFVRIRGRVRQRQRPRQQQQQIYNSSPEQQYQLQSAQVSVLRNPQFPIDVLPDDVQTTTQGHGPQRDAAGLRGEEESLRILEEESIPALVTSPHLQQEIYTTTEKLVETTTPRLRHNTNFLVRGSNRRPVRPAATSPTQEITSDATTTAHPDKVYTVRPVRRPSPAPQNKVSIKGRVRRPTRPTTSTTPSTTSSSLPYVPPSAAANEVPLDEDGPSRPWGFFSDSIALKPTTPTTTTTEIVPTTRRFQVALLDSAPQDYQQQDYERQRQIPQQGQYQVVRRRKPARQRQQQYISQQQYEDNPEFVSEYQNGNGFLLNLQHDQASLPSDNNPTHVMGSPETAEESRWMLASQRNTIPAATEKLSETETTWSEEQLTTELPPQSSITTTTTAKYVAEQTTHNKTSQRTHGNGGKRRGAWVRVRVRPQQSSTDLLETAESQNVATVAAANLIPGSDIIHKHSSTAAWASETFITTTPKGAEDVAETINDTVSDEKGNNKWSSSSDWWGEAGVHPNHRPYYSDNSAAAAEISGEGQSPASETSIWDMERYQQKSNFTNDSVSLLNSSKHENVEKEEDDYLDSPQSLPQDNSGYKVWEDFSEDVHAKEIYKHKEREEKKKSKKTEEVTIKNTTSPKTSTEPEVTTANPLFPAEMTTVVNDETSLTTEQNATTEEAPETTLPVETNASSIRHTDMHSLMKKILGTSTSTKVSHETEICYRGRCVKTKSKDLSHDEPSQDQVSTD